MYSPSALVVLGCFVRWLNTLLINMGNFIHVSDKIRCHGHCSLQANRLLGTVDSFITDECSLLPRITIIKQEFYCFHLIGPSVCYLMFFYVICTLQWWRNVNLACWMLVSRSLRRLNTGKLNLQTRCVCVLVWDQFYTTDMLTQKRKWVQG